MSTKAIRELIAQASGVVDTDVTLAAEREVEALEKKLRETQETLDDVVSVAQGLLRRLESSKG